MSTENRLTREAFPVFKAAYACEPATNGIKCGLLCNPDGVNRS